MASNVNGWYDFAEMEFADDEKLMYRQHKYLWEKLVEAGLLETSGHESTVAPTIYDVGANRGQSVNEYCLLFPTSEIHAFEPNKDLNPYLDSVRESYPNNLIKILNIGLGDKAEERPFNIYADDGVSSFLRAEAFLKDLNSLSWQFKSDNSVRLVTLDQYVADQSRFPDIFKIDVQGFDLSVLRGGVKLLRSGRVSIIGIEVLFARNYEGQDYFWDIANFLFENGYHFFDFPRLVNTTRGNMYFGDATFLSSQAWDLLEFL